MLKPLCTVLSSILLLMAVMIVSAQDNPVPDLTGLNVPQVAAALNRAGFALGEAGVAVWSPDSGVAENTIVSQSVAAGETAAAGTAIAFTVARLPNVTVRYDDNDLTMMNRSGSEMALIGLVFNAKDTTRAAAMGSDRWNAERLKTEDCLQVWSVGRREPKAIEGCGYFYWISSTNPDFHFWTSLNGVSTFSVTLSGIEYATCPAAPAGTEPMDCNFYLPISSASEVTPFVQFSYTTTGLTIYNRTTDRWMSLVGLTAGGQSISDPFLYGSPTIVGKIPLLAPNQCLTFGDTEPTEACDVIAHSTASFWNAPFTISGTSTGSDYECPAATADKITVCIMPR